MSKYVPDISTKRWVIVSPIRIQRPIDATKKRICPFCEGHENQTTPEIMRFGKGEPNKPGWLVRVIPNKYPITDVHEIIIHTPLHDRDIEHLPHAQTEIIFKAYRERYNLYKKRGQVFIFCNHGEHAGASLNHPHSQLVVLPNQINIDTVVKEPIQNIISENKFFILYCPDFSQWPYEVWIAPKTEGKLFGDIIDEEINHLSYITQTIIKKLEKIYKKNSLITNMLFAYNYYIYPKENWYLRIIPRFIHRAGFELGTGLSVNIVDPQDAAVELGKE